MAEILLRPKHPFEREQGPVCMAANRAASAAAAEIVRLCRYREGHGYPKRGTTFEKATRLPARFTPSWESAELVECDRNRLDFFNR